MKLAVIALSEDGVGIAMQITTCYPDSDIFVQPRLGKASTGLKVYEGDLQALIGSIFDKYDGLVFIASTGIAVRMIAPYLKSKKTDPAVVVADDTGRFVISLLSGHLGGANDLAENIAAKLNAVPVITTSTDRHGITAFDTIARRRGWAIENLSDLKHISSAQIEGREITVFCDDNISFKMAGYYSKVDNVAEALKKRNSIVFITGKSGIFPLETNIPYIILRPRSICAGVGCRRDTPAEKVHEALLDAFAKAGRDIKTLCSIATVDVKSDEKGIIDTAKALEVHLNIYDRDKLKVVEHLFESSSFVNQQIGVGSVAEPCAYLGSSKGRIILGKTAYGGITVSLAEAYIHMTDS